MFIFYQTQFCNKIGIVSIMRKTQEATIVHDVEKNVTEWVTKGANGVSYSTYQKRSLGVRAGG